MNSQPPSRRAWILSAAIQATAFGGALFVAAQAGPPTVVDPPGVPLAAPTPSESLAMIVAVS